MYEYVHNVNATPEMYNRVRYGQPPVQNSYEDCGRPYDGGIKVIKNNYIKAEELSENEFDKLPKARPYPRRLVCGECRSELEYDKSSIRMGEYGCIHVKCPLCNYDNMIDDHEDNITLTVDNIEFPVHFHHVSKKHGAKERPNKDVQEEIKKAIEWFRRNKNEDVYTYHTWCGDLFIMVHRWSGDEEYEVVISRDFYNMEISFEEEDYE